MESSTLEPVLENACRRPRVVRVPLEAPATEESCRHAGKRTGVLVGIGVGDVVNDALRR
jgi:hypothetical protein